MIKLITCDIDGTLLHGYSDPIEPELFDLIEKFYEKGVLFFATSGRQLYNLQKIFKPVKDKIGYIAENGAIIQYNNEIIYKSAIDIDIAKKLSQKILNKDNVELFICGEHTTYIMPKCKDFGDLVGNEIQNHITEIKSFDEIDQDIVKVSLFYKEGINDEIIQYFVSDFGDKFQHTVSGHTWYDFMNLDTHKGNAIKILQNVINVSSEETVAFGDNFNDIEMLADAKYSYAMENAHQDVKKVAKYTCKCVIETLKEIYNKFFSEG
ncbi:HAD family hydrolase [uncultured Tyzzerella sp.]|uniref:HAD family hydrolase n=1 Tax=uncultured Tyzzerella sp. TaxID=2321398 RepID=UPI002943E30E|nr:HAD family hydrolase [uncultured Tyzzerella sp.]